MWLETILTLNALVAAFGGYVLFKQSRNYCIWLFEGIFLLYFVVRPLSIVYLGLLSFDLMRFGTDIATVTTYALCGLIFAIVFHVSVRYLYDKTSLFVDRCFKVYNFDRIRTSRLVLLLLFFTSISYLANAFKFHSLTYFAETQDSFAAMMSLAGGLWFVQQLSTVILFPLIVLVARNVDGRLSTVFKVLLFALTAFLVVAKPSTRTEIVALIVAVAIYWFSTGRMRFSLLTAATGVIGLVGLLFGLNLVRLGGLQNNTQVSALSIVIGFADDISSADSGMILVDYMKHHPWLYFQYLAPSMLPVSLIPTAILPFKPRTDIEGVLTNAIFGGDLDPLAFHEGGTLTFTVPVSGYADLGFMGTAISSFLYALIFVAYLRGWKSRSRTIKFVTVYFLVITIAGFRLSVEPLMTNCYWYLLVMWALWIVSRERRDGVVKQV